MTSSFLFQPVLARAFVFSRCHRGLNRASIVLVVSPLIALMTDQARSLTEKGLSVAKILSERDFSEAEDGQHQILLISPELLLRKRQCKRILREAVYRENVVAVGINEAHLVVTWYVI